MMDEDKTREQLVAELARLCKEVANALGLGGGVGADSAGPCADPRIIEDMLKAVHRSPTITIVWRAGEGWPVSFVSEGIRRYGHIPQDLIGLANHERYVAAEDLPPFLTTFVRAGSSPHSRSFAREYRLLTRFGEARWVRERMWVERDDHGQITHFAGLLTDIQELRQLEAVVREQKQRLSALFEYATQPILLHDLGGRCIDANLAACDYLGYTRDELLQVPFDALFNPETAARVQRLAREATDSREAMLESELVGRDDIRLPVVLECRIIDLDGVSAVLTIMQHRPYSPAPARPPPDSTDDALRRPSLWRGSSEGPDALRRRVEELEGANRSLQEERDALAAARSRYEERLRGQEVLLRDVHHRVKNNLQVIASLLGLQAESIQDPKALDAFAESQNRVRAMALVHERIYQGEDLARVDLGAYVRDLIERLFVALGADPAIALHIDVEPISLPMDSAIPCGLLISELVSNSIEHAFPEGRGGSLRVTLHRRESDPALGRAIVLTVADDGVGLPEGLDYRHAESLGLQLVTILAQQLDATVDLDTSAGTRFTITFRDGT